MSIVPGELGGVNAKVAGSVSEDRSLFGATDREGGGSWTSRQERPASRTRTARDRRVCSFMEWAI